jgi:hypothetical protein
MSTSNECLSILSITEVDSGYKTENNKSVE